MIPTPIRIALTRIACVTVLASIAAAGAPAYAADVGSTPTLSIRTLDDQPFELAAQKGRWVIVNFWATWCAPCIKEMPDLSAFVASRKDVSAIGIAWEDTERAEIVAFAKAHPVVYPLAQGDVNTPLKDFESPRGLPTTYLIDPQGRIAKKITGPVTANDLEKAIAAARGG